MRLVTGGIALGSLIIAYKAGIYMNAAYKLRKERKQKIVNLGTYSEYKKRLEKEKED
jgi:hypothetical protein